MAESYDAGSIQVLGGLEGVRKRPSMYIGSTGPEGLQHLMVEIFDNSRDEAMNGYADEIEVIGSDYCTSTVMLEEYYCKKTISKSNRTSS